MNAAKLIGLLFVSVATGLGGAWLYAKMSPAPAPRVEATAENQAYAGPDVEPGLPPEAGPVPVDLSLASQPAPAQSAPSQPAPAMCAGVATPGGALAGDRFFGHFSYAEPGDENLTAPPAGFAGANCQLIHKDMAQSLSAMRAAASKEEPAVGRALMGISCYRSIERQRALFCNPAKIASRGMAGQAQWVAPAGYSEHATGLTIDFGARTRSECHVSPCFEGTQTGKWLRLNARKFGFEMSFPKGNQQGVNYEPWHFRWVGNDAARAVFAKASSQFPGE